MKLLSSLLISYRAMAMRLRRKSETIIHITHLNTLNNLGHSLIHDFIAFHSLAYLLFSISFWRKRNWSAK